MSGIYDIRRRRPDLSPYFFHFTKGSNPKSSLKKILSEEKLISDKGYVCFTESPIVSMIPLLEYFAGFPYPMYSKYAIGFNRKLLINDFNAQPVIYGVSDDEKYIGETLKWKYLRCDFSNDKEFQWLREWRIKGNSCDFSSFPKDEIIVIAPTDDDLRELAIDEDYDIDFAYEHEIGGCHPVLLKTNTRNWIGFSIEAIKRQNLMNDFILSGITLFQQIGETDV